MNPPATFATGALLLLLFAPRLTAQPDTQAAKRNEMFFKALAGPALVRGGTVEPHWLADGRRFWFRSGVGDPTIFLVDAVAGTKAPFFDEALRQALKPGPASATTPKVPSSASSPWSTARRRPASSTPARVGS